MAQRFIFITPLYARIVSPTMLETVVMDRITESRKSEPQLIVLAARNMGKTATQGEQLSIMNSEMTIALSENFV